jgi:hypothetical protein
LRKEDFKLKVLAILRLEGKVFITPVTDNVFNNTVPSQ